MIPFWVLKLRLSPETNPLEIVTVAEEILVLSMSATVIVMSITVAEPFSV